MTTAGSKMTVPKFTALKKSGQKITMLTAYDYPFARLLDAAGVEGILVGDSLAMVVQGRENTLPVSLEEILYHAEIVGRAVERALVVVDLPFPCQHLGSLRAIEDAARVFKQTRCHAVKLEGGKEQADIIRALVDAGIPVMAHCGLRPQNVHLLGGYKVQREEDRLMRDAEAAADAGAFAMVLECVGEAIARRITEKLSIPTIGIGAGSGCDGQILVTHDLLGLTSGYVPKFVKGYADLGKVVSDAVTRFRDDVREGKFPGADQSFQ